MTATKPAGLAGRLRSGEDLLGVIVKMPCAATIESCGHHGADLVLIDTEHGPGDHLLLENHLRAADVAGVPALVRVPAIDTARIGGVLDSGATGVIAPHVSDPAQAALLTRACHYPPAGDRGFALTTRAGCQGTVDPADHLKSSGESTCVGAQIEDPVGVDNAAEIVATPGIDMIWIGLNDLAMSMGSPPSTPDAAVLARRQHVITASREAGVAVALVAGDADDVAAHRAVGVTVHLFTATGLFNSALRSQLGRARP